jgi:hypothetical protein
MINIIHIIGIFLMFIDYIFEFCNWLNLKLDFKFRYSNHINLERLIAHEDFKQIERYFLYEVYSILKFTDYGIIVDTFKKGIIHIKCNKDYQDFLLLKLEGNLYGKFNN